MKQINHKYKKRDSEISHRGFVTDHKAAGFDAGANGHFSAFNVHQALEAGMSGLRVRQVLSFQDQLAGDTAWYKNVLNVSRAAKPRAVSRSMCVKMSRILHIRKKT